MSSNIKIEKTCMFCGEKFTAKTTVTKYCSHKCASRAYKVRAKEEKIQKATEQETEHAILFNPIVNKKEYLSIKEACMLLGASRWTIYRMIDKGQLPAAKIGRRTIIQKSDIENLFNKAL